MRHDRKNNPAATIRAMTTGSASEVELAVAEVVAAATESSDAGSEDKCKSPIRLNVDARSAASVNMGGAFLRPGRQTGADDDWTFL